MTLDDFYLHLNLPDSGKLDVPIYKKQLLDNAAFSTADRKLIAEQVDSVKWRYVIKPANCAITRYDDAERDYGEIALLHITLKTKVGASYLKRLGELLQRAIPYPLVLVFVATEGLAKIKANDQQTATQLALCLADKRFNRADASKLTIAQLFETSWINLNALNEVENAFLFDLNIARCDQQHLYALYSDWTRCIVSLDIARQSGQYHRSRSAETHQHRQQTLQAMRQCENQLASLLTQLKVEPQFNRQLELNVRIKQFQHQRADYILQLLENKQTTDAVVRN